MQKEELFFHLLEELIGHYSDVTVHSGLPEPSNEVKMDCGFSEEHYTEKCTREYQLHLLRVNWH